MLAHAPEGGLLRHLTQDTEPLIVVAQGEEDTAQLPRVVDAGLRRGAWRGAQLPARLPHTGERTVRLDVLRARPGRLLDLGDEEGQLAADRKRERVDLSGRQ